MTRYQVQLRYPWCREWDTMSEHRTEDRAFAALDNQIRRLRNAGDRVRLRVLRLDVISRPVAVGLGRGGEGR